MAKRPQSQIFKRAPQKFAKWMNNMPDDFRNVITTDANYTTSFKVPESIKDQVGKNHPYVNEKNHLKLLRHIIERMQMAREVRDTFAQRLRNIDIDVHGFVNLSDEDRERMRENRNGRGGQKPVDVNLPMAEAKLDEMITFLAEVFWPSSGMFQANAAVDQQAAANGLVKSLKTQAKKRQHYSKIVKWFYEALRYNFAAFAIEWVQEAGFKIKNGAGRAPQVAEDPIIFEGNELDNLDPYNTFYDISCAPSEIAAKGEYFADVKLFSKFSIKKMAAKGDLYGIERFINKSGGQMGTSVTYFEEHPVVRRDYNTISGSNTDWLRFATGGRYGTIGNGIELIRFWTWINPSEFGLSDDDEMQIWRFKVANHLYITDCEHLTNAHNRLPICITIPFDDNLRLQHKSAAEMLVDYNRFASFLMNTHQTATRRKLFGVTIYDPSIVDLQQQGTEVAGRIPLLPAGWGKKPEEAVHVYNDAPDTDHLVDQADKVYDMMNKILPTNIQNQVADLERATEFQAAATVQGANRRQFKMAKVIDDQAITSYRYMMIYNTLQYQTKPVNIVGPDGKTQQVTPDQLRDLDLEEVIGDGIQGIDKIITMHLMQNMLNSILQNKDAATELDVVKFMNYVTQLAGENVDLNQFRKTQPTQQEQHDQSMDTAGAAADLAQAAQGQGTPGGQGSETGGPQ